MCAICKVTSCRQAVNCIEKTDEISFELVEHLPCFSDLTPSDNFSLAKLKKLLKGKDSRQIMKSYVPLGSSLQTKIKNVFQGYVSISLKADYVVK